SAMGPAAGMGRISWVQVLTTLTTFSAGVPGRFPMLAPCRPATDERAAESALAASPRCFLDGDGPTSARPRPDPPIRAVTAAAAAKILAPRGIRCAGLAGRGRSARTG